MFTFHLKYYGDYVPILCSQSITGIMFQNISVKVLRGLCSNTFQLKFYGDYDSIHFYQRTLSYINGIMFQYFEYNVLILQRHRSSKYNEGQNTGLTIALGFPRGWREKTLLRESVLMKTPPGYMRNSAHPILLTTPS